MSKITLQLKTGNFLFLGPISLVLNQAITCDLKDFDDNHLRAIIDLIFIGKVASTVRPEKLLSLISNDLIKQETEFRYNTIAVAFESMEVVKPEILEIEEEEDEEVDYSEFAAVLDGNAEAVRDAILKLKTDEVLTEDLAKFLQATEKEGKCRKSIIRYIETV